MLQRKTIVIAIIALIIVLLGGYLFLSNEGEEPTASGGGLGQEGSRCSGPERLPCMPGMVCEIPENGTWGVDYGVCVEDDRPPATVVNEGETCNNVDVVCGMGMKCVISEGQSEGRCEQMVPNTRPFIMSVIPEDMELENGAYRANPGTEIIVRVHAMNVEEGEIYLKPLWVSHSGVMEDEKVGDLMETDTLDEYTASFIVEEDLGASLIAVMRNADGQEASVSINVAAATD
jgi:hypothetical protein